MFDVFLFEQTWQSEIHLCHLYVTFVALHFIYNAIVVASEFDKYCNFLKLFLTATNKQFNTHTIIENFLVFAISLFNRIYVDLFLNEEILLI